MPHIVIALKNFKLVCYVIPVLVKVVSFALVNVDKLCKLKLIILKLKLFDGKKRKICCFQIGTINDFVYLNVNKIIFTIMSKRLSFASVDPIAILGLGRGI